MQVNHNTTTFSRAHAVHTQLLFQLKATVETLFLTNKSDDSWTNTTGSDRSGLLRLHTCVEHIFLNGIRLYKHDVSDDYVVFVC